MTLDMLAGKQVVLPRKADREALGSSEFHIFLHTNILE
jgi:hypothetical protein